MRNSECRNYDECLDVAAKGNFNFNCDRCDGKTIITPKKIGRPKGRPKMPRVKIPETEAGERISRNRVYADFTNYPELFDLLVKEANREFRSLSNQMLFYCKQGVGSKKK